MKRSCAICGSKKKDKLYEQKYLLPNKRNLLTYDVVGCNKCGFIFADNVPSQKEYDRYYQNSSKYTYNRNIPRGLLSLYQDLYSIAEKIIDQDQSAPRKKDFQILDVGCSIGSFLSMFKKKGFSRLFGVEPSHACSRLARDLYGIEVFPGTLSAYKTDDRFDLIVMTGVLEHVSDFTKILPFISSLLKESGKLMVAVPDAANFSSNPVSPYDEFSIEHINFFTKRSLANLMNNFCLKMTHSRSIQTSFYDSTVMVSFFKKTRANKVLEYDRTGISGLKKYISACRTKLIFLEKEFRKLIKSDERIIVWGVGSLTYRLLASTNLTKTKISAFVDSNKSLQGKRIRNTKIMPPDYLYDVKQGTVFIASHIYGHEIENILRKKYQFEGKVICI